MTAHSETVETARTYYNSDDADRFYAAIWGGEDIHIGLYETPDDVIFDASRRTVAHMAEKLSSLQPGARVLDLGSGYGGAARYLAAERGLKVVALNLAEAQNERARALVKDQGLGDQVEVVDGSFENIPYGADSYDAIWSQDAILHSGDRPRVMAEVARVLRPGGHFVFTDPMQADDCPAGVLDPILARIHLESLASPSFYRAQADVHRWHEVSFEDLTHQLTAHYTAVLRDTTARRQELVNVVSPDYVDNMKAGLQRWIDGGHDRHLRGASSTSRGPRKVDAPGPRPEGSKLQLNPTVFFGSVAIILAMLIAAVVATGDVEAIFGGIQSGIVDRFGWFYILSMTGFLVFAIWVTLGPYGHVRLGPDDSRPAYSLPTWFAMLFSAGMGIGLLFFSVAEPMQHYVSPPVGRGASLDAARDAMGLTFFHWGLHPWGVYALVGLALAYFSFRKGGKLTIRATLVPLLGDRAYGRIGDLVDILAVVGTLFGVATSLGLGAMQVNAGLHHVAGVSETAMVQMVIIACITAAATLSVVSGLDAGIRRLSELNMALAGLLLVFVLLAGPTAFLFNAFVENIGTYLQHLPKNSFWTASFEEPQRREWLGNWTVFYWAWWIAWAPFVGMFIARVSKGRTIREFMLGVLLAPTFAGFVWLTIFGDSALHAEVFGNGGIAAAATDSDKMPTAIFLLLEKFPLSAISGGVCTVCIVLFFVTSSDSASLVVDTIASGGSEDPPVWQRIFWAVLEGAVAAVLLWAGGLKALQTAAITAALPFTLVIIAMCVALVHALRREPQRTAPDP